MYTIIISIQLYPETIKIQNIKKHSLSQFSQIISRKKKTHQLPHSQLPRPVKALIVHHAREVRVMGHLQCLRTRLALVARLPKSRTGRLKKWYTIPN